MSFLLSGGGNNGQTDEIDDLLAELDSIANNDNNNTNNDDGNSSNNVSSDTDSRPNAGRKRLTKRKPKIQTTIEDVMRPDRPVIPQSSQQPETTPPAPPILNRVQRIELTPVNPISSSSSSPSIPRIVPTPVQSRDIDDDFNFDDDGGGGGGGGMFDPLMPQQRMTVSPQSSQQQQPQSRTTSPSSSSSSSLSISINTSTGSMTSSPNTNSKKRPREPTTTTKDKGPAIKRARTCTKEEIIKLRTFFITQKCSMYGSWLGSTDNMHCPTYANLPAFKYGSVDHSDDEEEDEEGGHGRDDGDSTELENGGSVNSSRGDNSVNSIVGIDGMHMQNTDVTQCGSPSSMVDFDLSVDADTSSSSHDDNRCGSQTDKEAGPGNLPHTNKSHVESGGVSADFMRDDSSSEDEEDDEDDDEEEEEEDVKRHRTCKSEKEKKVQIPELFMRFADKSKQRRQQQRQGKDNHKSHHDKERGFANGTSYYGEYEDGEEDEDDSLVKSKSKTISRGQLRSKKKKDNNSGGGGGGGGNMENSVEERMKRMKEHQRLVDEIEDKIQNCEYVSAMQQYEEMIVKKFAIEERTNREQREDMVRRQEVEERNRIINNSNPQNWRPVVHPVRMQTKIKNLQEDLRYGYGPNDICPICKYGSCDIESWADAKAKPGNRHVATFKIAYNRDFPHSKNIYLFIALTRFWNRYVVGPFANFGEKNAALINPAITRGHFGDRCLGHKNIMGTIDSFLTDLTLEYKSKQDGGVYMEEENFGWRTGNISVSPQMSKSSHTTLLMIRQFLKDFQDATENVGAGGGGRSKRRSHARTIRRQRDKQMRAGTR